MRRVPYWAPLRAVGAALFLGGLTALVRAFVRFAVEGLGTPAPVAPPERLVVGGLYRYVRNPMYLFTIGVIVRQALALAQPVLLAYAAVVGAAAVAFVRWYEEPNLLRRFGAKYETYRSAVPGWWPRSRPWDPGEASPPVPGAGPGDRR